MCLSGTFSTAYQKGNDMTKSQGCELLMALWSIAAILSFAHSYDVFGWVCATLAAINFGIGVYVS